MAGHLRAASCLLLLSAFAQTSAVAAGFLGTRKSAADMASAAAEEWMGGGRALTAAEGAAAAAATSLPTGQPYQMGTYTVSDIWVNPTAGNDANSGATRTLAKRTLSAAWAMIPASTTLSTSGYRIRATAGQFTESMRE